MMIAIVCMLALGYLAVVRRERLAGFWTVAWALLVARYAWAAYWGSPYPTPWASLVAGMLRIAFAMTVLTGALALRGMRLRWWWTAAVTIGLPVIALLLIDVVGTTISTRFVLFTMMALLLVAAERLATASDLPRFERSAMALSVASYAALSALATQLPNGSTAFMTATVAAWGTQLLIAMSVLATFFRISYDAEIAQHAAVETRLTQALGGFVHLCMHCKAVRNDRNVWEPLEQFIAERTSSMTSHGLCVECAQKHYPDEFGGAGTAGMGDVSRLQRREA